MQFIDKNILNTLFIYIIVVCLVTRYRPTDYCIRVNNEK